MDWDKLGLKMGLEIHQQLDSESKLFCPCSCNLTDKESEYEIFRNLRPTQSELGKIDRAAFEEARRKLRFKYQAYSHETCLVEADEEPPHPLNEEALELASIIASLLNMRIVDEFHTMRKQVIDGSNTGGFQRTGLVATDGFLETPYGKVKIENLCLEEDAARRIETTKNGVTFRLDRLGIPLVEITTDPSIHHPDQVKEVAYQLGQVLRSTRVKRGLGTIRQDLNISIKEGARVEIKGVQDLDLMPEMVEREVKRQIKLVEIREELKKRSANVPDTRYDINELFKDTTSKIIASAPSVIAIKLEGFNGLVGMELQPGRRLGTEFSSYAKKLGVSGIFHTDELPAYGITKEEVIKLREFTHADVDDAVIIVAHEKDIAIAALEEVQRRAKMALKGVVEETRKALPDGNSEFLRPLPTSSRMYLETDIPLFPIERDYVKKIQSNLPELPQEKKERIIKEYGLSEDLAGQLVRRNQADDFEEILSEMNVDKIVVASLLAYSLKELKRDGHDIDNLDLEVIKEVLKLLEEDKVSKDALSDIIGHVADNQVTPLKAAQSLNLIMLSEDDAAKIIENIVVKNENMVKERGMGAMGPLMGMAMKELKGKADGKLVNKLLRENIGKFL
ncbi:MAG: Glu-tRNA(Gln) amidotransferase subunit GatE [Methanobacteriaceae archaeon]|jgi:glutamyl-tRNA(Gln) amidotransferase subunit E|nr:Glu-tRNA(Gln) amidotransferase subunit GatE [Methanobacteriaceae archaeon]MDP2836067.1 Glu-tRNA(Gln) amidotransferase subunit GatE [Methanobacteriaceae archaeon]MDP3033553.1 Glu-tRNA(Gln) amidotransferase subunit GatE [Methanobacteriaceae archaeon]MDP3484474.1 Glu-tRNA(Gln) amidotransferase subunit GatE [Methanobacteriaceae archaeon]MDP3623538.1 Glu-tRNA(Gln) amidotransferase subunit GatE [Methanobacteriaceae archaeon]